jgi:eukaryotic-like serine/threonine-protein kinase
MDGRVLPRQPGDPRRLGPYELLERLGEGGMGVVFLGRERRGGRLAAVKALRQELAGDAAFAARFRREVQAAGRVDSPRVARVLGADPAGPRPWLATEYLPGPTLSQAVAAGGPLVGERLAEFAAGVAEALTAIHAAGVVHRDLKPSNVLLQDGSSPSTRHRPDAAPGAGGVKVIDFGIASAADATLTRSGLRFGTPSWMAPEQLRDHPAGPPADVFAWGALVAFAATGRHPFGGGPAEAVAYRILHDPPDLTGIPGPLRDLVGAALSRDPAARPSAARLATTLTAALTATLLLPATTRTPIQPVAGGAAGSEATPTPPRRRRRRVGGLLVVLALLAGLVTAPHVVLAAVGSPDDPAGQHPSKHCPDDAGKQDVADDREEERDDLDDQEEQPADQHAGTTWQGDSDRGEERSAGDADQEQQPPRGQAPSGPGAGAGKGVLGS